MSNWGYISVMLEQIRDEIRAVYEEVAGIRDTVNSQTTRDKFDELKQDTHVLKAAMADVSHDMKAIKALVRDNSRELAHHERRIARLEVA